MSMLGLDLDDLDVFRARDAVLARAARGEFGYVVTPNADHFARLGRLKALRPVYRDAFLTLLDSRFLALLAGALGLTPPRVVTGSDLAPQLLGAARGAVVVLGMNAAEVAVLERKFPSTAFWHRPLPMGLRPWDEAFAEAVAFAAAAPARLIFIAVGSPLQEVLAAAIGAASDRAGVALCVGAALEYCAGSRRRAPVAMRRLGLEWLWRLVSEPRRLALRYLLRDPPVLLRLLGEALRRKARRSRGDRRIPDPAATIAARDPCPPERRAPLREIRRKAPLS